MTSGGDTLPAAVPPAELIFEIRIPIQAPTIVQVRARTAEVPRAPLLDARMSSQEENLESSMVRVAPLGRASQETRDSQRMLGSGWRSGSDSVMAGPSEFLYSGTMPPEAP